jgi:hypothetical protein
MHTLHNENRRALCNASSSLQLTTIKSLDWINWQEICFLI